MDDLEKLLPIGSVVILKGGKKKIVIIGIKQTDIATNTLYDYLTIPYPEGFLNSECMFFANHDAIESVIFRGYEDDERNDFMKRLSDYYKNEQNNQ